MAEARLMDAGDPEDHGMCRAAELLALEPTNMLPESLVTNNIQYKTIKSNV